MKKLVLLQNVCEVELAPGVSGHTLLMPGWTVSVSESLQCVAPKCAERERTAISKQSAPMSPTSGCSSSELD